MTITTTQIGTYTQQITLSNESSFGPFITALDAAIVNAGWTQHDIVNTYNRVYKSLNKDGTTYKYIQVLIDVGTQMIGTTAWETWNASTHVGTNPTTTIGRGGGVGFTLSQCDFIVLGSSRWLFFQAFNKNNMTNWQGVFEFAREVPEDTAAAGYPCYGWTAGHSVLGASNNFANSPNAYTTTFALPRTRAGQTGWNATYNTAWVTPYLRLGSNINAGSAAYSSLPSFKTYPWDTTKAIVQSLRAVANISEMHGKVFGMKVTYNIGNPYNKVNVPVDGDLNYSQAGTPTEHWVLPMAASICNSGTPFATGNGANGSPQTSSVSHSGAAITGVCTGNALYLGSTNQLVTKVDLTAATMGAPATIQSTSSSIVDLAFDGRYVYASHQTLGIYRIDTQNADAVTSLSIASGCGAMYFDGTYLWAAQLTAAASMKVYKIDPATFTIAATITTAGSDYIGGICGDCNGFVYVGDRGGKITRIAQSQATATLSVWVNIASQLGLPGQTTNNLLCDGDYVYYIGCTIPTTATYYAAAIDIRTGSPATGLLSTTGLTAPASPQMRLPVARYGHMFYVLSQQATSVPVIAIPVPVAGTSTMNATGVTAPPGVSSPTAMVSDGSRIWFVGANVLTQFNNMIHADDQTITCGRVLLPK